MATPNDEQIAALALLRDLTADFDATHDTLSKILGNIVTSPAEPKFRKLKTTNNRIKALLEVGGALKLLLGSGFVEEVEALQLPEAADLAPVTAALESLKSQQAKRKEVFGQAQREAVKAARDASHARREAAQAAAEANKPAQAAAEPKAKASHILLKVSDTASYDDCALRLTRLKAILDDQPHHLIPSKFAEMAKEHSQCDSKSRGGALGTFARGKHDHGEEIDEVAFTKPTGKTYVVKNTEGVSLLWLQTRSK